MDTSGLEIKRATLDDLPLLMEWRMEVLRDVFSDYGSAADTPQLRAANQAYYEEALANGSHIACFALLDGQPVACGAVCLQREMPSPDNPSGINAYVMNMYTRPAYRGNKISHRVVKWLIDAARERGAQKIYLEATDMGRVTYEAVGFVDLPNMMHLPVVTDAEGATAASIPPDAALQSKEGDR